MSDLTETKPDSLRRGYWSAESNEADCRLPLTFVSRANISKAMPGRLIMATAINVAVEFKMEKNAQND